MYSKLGLAALLSFAFLNVPNAFACDFCMLAQGISPYLTATGRGLTVSVDYRELDHVYDQAQNIDSKGKKEAWTVFSLTGFYPLTENLTLLATLPYTSKSNVDVDGTITSGLGDLTLTGRYTLLRNHSPESTLAFGVLGGVKLPTGTTNNRDAQGNPVDRHAFPGTGSFDFDLGLSTYWTVASGFQLTVDAIYRISTTGKWAERDHRFGNTLNYSARAFYRVSQAESGSFFPFFGVSGESTGGETGAEDPATGDYNPRLSNPSTGGTVLFADFGLYSVLGSNSVVSLGFSKAFYHFMNFDPAFAADPAENYKLNLSLTFFAL